MSSQNPGPSIADRSRVAKSALIRLLSEIKSKEADLQLTIQSENVQDLIDKFSLWAGSLGALLPPSRKLSLDYRLQDAEDIRDQICDYLDDLQEAIEDLGRIVTGESPNRDMHGDSDDDDEAGTEEVPEDEAHMILEVISECLRSLFRIAVLVRQASPQDRFKRALQHSELAFPDVFDITHVEHKHIKLTQQDSRWLAKRLGSAVAKRRQFIKYCRDHKSRLGVDLAELSVEVGNQTEIQSSKATEFIKANYVNLESLQVQVEEPDDALSLMTASTTFDSDALLKLPRLADLSPDGQEFECPICFTLQKFLKEKAWKSHAYRDLKPYVCTFNDERCKNELFDDRNSWFAHELQHHRSHYTCSLCKQGPFISAVAIISHTKSAHGAFPSDQMTMLIDSGRKAPALLNARDCPFCDDWAETLQCRGEPKGKQVSGQGAGLLVSSTRFRRHVATHQEQLAIFAVPRATEEMGSRSSGSENSLSLNTLSTWRSGADDQTSQQSKESHHVQDHEPPVIPVREYTDSFEEEAQGASYSIDNKLDVQVESHRAERGEANGTELEQFGAANEEYKEPLKFKDAMGRKFSFPFNMCNTWSGMENLVKEIFLHVEVIGPHVQDGHYDLVGPEGEVILPSVWQAVVQPGWAVEMYMWPLDSRPGGIWPRPREGVKEIAHDDRRVDKTSIAAGEDRAPIKFKDAVGRKFSFPFHLCETWSGMEDLIKEAFLHVEVLGPHVQDGHYDLVGPDSKIVLPSAWEEVVQPGWEIRMLMWPIDKVESFSVHQRSERGAGNVPDSSRGKG